jgi:hypothetical protein
LTGIAKRATKPTGRFAKAAIAAMNAAIVPKRIAIATYAREGAKMETIDEQRREIAAAKNVLRMTANQKTYSVRALSLMTLGRGALIGALRHGG